MLDIKQKRAVECVEGPLLIIAGPGTGKTFTLVERVKYMIEEKNIELSKILISTFTNKAAFELKDRLSIKFSKENIDKDINEMLIGNFHSICRQINDKYLEYTNLRLGYTQIDDIAQLYLIKRYLPKFREIKNYTQIINNKNESKNILNLVNKIREEGILNRNSENSISDTSLKILQLYENILIKNNMIDFTGILFTTYKLLFENEKIRNEMREKINYIMVDEYQDTNTIQEKIIFLLLNENNNICVVGDDDQSLYRFRGASVKNILKFEDKIENVQIVKLNQNFRSNHSIIQFYRNYIDKNIKENEELKKYRHDKILYSAKISDEDRVIKIVGKDEEEWIEKTYKLVIDLVKYEAVNAFNEIALLFSSVNHPSVQKLMRYFKNKGIDIYIPKTSTLISRREVECMIGAIYGIFKEIIEKNIQIYDIETLNYLENKYEIFYKKAIKNEDIQNFINNMKKYFSDGNFTITLYDIYYRLFAYKPFYDYMLNENTAKNMSRFLELINTFSLINQVFYIDEKNIVQFLNLFFFDFIAFIKDQKIAEFEEETKIPDENSVSFMTIHASKGLEYPVVIMGSLWDKIYPSRYKSNIDKVVDLLREELGEKDASEPHELANELDFYRKYYTGFSRAKELLVLSAYNSNFGGISEQFQNVLDNLEEKEIVELSIEKGEKKDNKIKKSYSFTTDIVPYNNSPIEYYYKRILKFNEPATLSLTYGSIVHESIEFINKKIISKEDIENINISEIVYLIARQKYLSGQFRLNKEIVEKAVFEVEKYVNDIEKLGIPLYSELEISYSTDDYILEGNVDAIFEKNGEKHLVDFKTGEFPQDEVLEEYFNQISLYASLYLKTKKELINKLSLYFTNTKLEKSIYSKNSELNNEGIFNLVEETIQNIENKKFYFKENYKSSKTLLRFFLDKYYDEISTSTKEE